MSDDWEWGESRTVSTPELTKRDEIRRIIQAADALADAVDASQYISSLSEAVGVFDALAAYRKVREGSEG